MAVARPSFDDGDFGIFDHVRDQPLAAARDQHVHVAADRQQRVRAGAFGALDQGDRGGIKAVCRKGVADDAADGFGASDRLFAAAQDRAVAALDAEGGDVERDVRARLVNDGDKP